FYVSSALLKGRKAEAGSVPRLSASEIEATVLKVIRTRLDCDGLAPAQCAENYIHRIIVHGKHLAITLKCADDIEAQTIEVAFKHQPKGHLAQIDERGANQSQRIVNPMLVQAIVRARNWVKSLSDGSYA